MEMQELGYNYRMPDMLTALGISQLKRADAGLQRRQEIAGKYDAAFRNLNNLKILNPAAYQTGTTNGEIKHAYHLYVIQVEKRKELYDFLRTKNIFAQVHYIPVHRMPYYQELGFKKDDFPLAEAYYEMCLSLPMYPSLTDEEQAYVIEQVLTFLQNS